VEAIQLLFIQLMSAMIGGGGAKQAQQAIAAQQLHVPDQPTHCNHIRAFKHSSYLHTIAKRVQGSQTLGIGWQARHGSWSVKVGMIG
jgi:hypothetical protein